MGLCSHYCTQQINIYIVHCGPDSITLLLYILRIGADVSIPNFHVHVSGWFLLRSFAIGLWVLPYIHLSPCYPCTTLWHAGGSTRTCGISDSSTAYCAVCGRITASRSYPSLVAASQEGVRRPVRVTQWQQHWTCMLSTTPDFCTDCSVWTVLDTLCDRLS